ALDAWWPLAMLAFGLLGFGFYLLHGSIQVFMTELAPEARGSAVALHSSSFFLGQAIGPIFYGLGFRWLRAPPAPPIAARAAATLLIAAGAVALIGLVTAHLLTRHPHAT